MKQSETQSRRTCKLPPLTRRQKILRNLILILLAFLLEHTMLKRIP
mgnify:CR=1 FL=1